MLSRKKQTRKQFSNSCKHSFWKGHGKRPCRDTGSEVVNCIYVSMYRACSLICRATREFVPLLFPLFLCSTTEVSADPWGGKWMGGDSDPDRNDLTGRKIFGSGHRWRLSLPGVAKHTGLGIKAVRAMKENAEWCPVLPTSPSPSLYTSPARSPQVQFSNCLQSANFGASFNQLLINFGLLFYVRTSDLKRNGISVLTCSESRCSCCLMTGRFVQK